MNDPLRRLRGTGQLVRQTLEVLANQRLGERWAQLMRDEVAALDLMKHGLNIGQDTETMCAGMILALRKIGLRMQPEQRCELGKCLYAVADELAAPTELPKP